MKKTIYLNDFRDAFINYNRAEQFSYSGLETLFENLQEYEEATGEEMELDVIAICCDFTEYENIQEFQKEYGVEYQTIEDVGEKTLVLYIDEESFIIQNF